MYLIEYSCDRGKPLEQLYFHKNRRITNPSTPTTHHYCNPRRIINGLDRISASWQERKKDILVSENVNNKMEDEFIKLFHEYKSCIEVGMSMDIQAFLKGREDIKEYNIKADETKKILISIKLNKFSKLSAKRLFEEFVSFVGYNGINLYICNDMVGEIKYLYLTATNSNCAGVKMEVEIE